MPCLLKKSSNAFDTYFPPLSVIRTLTICSDCLSIFEPCQHLAFGLKHVHLNLSQKIINEGEKIPCASLGQRFHRPTYIGMHKLQDLGGTYTSIRREWSLRLFVFHTSFACKGMCIALYCFHVHSPHHALKHFHAIRVEMPQPLVPKLQRMRALIGTRQKIRFHPIHHIGVQLVEVGPL